MTNKLVFTYWGAGIALGIYGTKAEVERTATTLYNHNATDSKPMWLSEDDKKAFAYVLTDWDRLKKGYTDIFIRAAIPKQKKLGRTLKKVCALRADQRLETIMPEAFLEHEKNDGEPYRLGFVNTLGDED